MIRLTILNIIIFFFGYFVVEIAAKKHLNMLEKLGIAVGAGYAQATLMVFFISWAGKEITFVKVISFLLIGLAIALAFLLSIKRLGPIVGEFIKEGKSLLKARRDVLDWFLMLTVSGLILTQFYKSLGFVFDTWDEFSFWGMAAKAIYTGKSVILTKVGLLPEFEAYPLFLPIASSLNNIAAGSSAENYSRLINPILLLGIVLFLSGFLQRLDLNIKEILLFIILLLSSGSVFSQMASILYGEISMAYFYSIAVLVFLINFIEKPRKEYYILSAIFFAFSSWVRVEGAQLSLLTLTLLLIFDYLFIRTEGLKEKLKMNTVLYGIILSIPVMWYVFGKMAGFGRPGWSTYLFSDLGAKISNIKSIAGSMYSQTILSNGWPIFWLIVAISVFISLLLFRRNNLTIIIFSIMLLNIVYLLLAYIFVFPTNQAIAAASFNRYIIHFLPIAVVFVAYEYRDLKILYDNKMPL